MHHLTTVGAKSTTGSSAESPRGIGVRVDLGTLIEAVYVAPDRPGWFSALVGSMLKTFGLDDQLVQPSSLDAAPVYFQKGI